MPTVVFALNYLFTDCIIYIIHIHTYYIRHHPGAHGVRICSLYQTHITLNCPDPDRDNLNTTNRSSFTILNKFTVSNIHKHINRDCFLPCRGIVEEKIYIWHLVNLVTISSGKIVWNHIIITFDKMCHTIYFVLACHNGTIWG